MADMIELIVSSVGAAAIGLLAYLGKRSIDALDKRIGDTEDLETRIVDMEISQAIIKTQCTQPASSKFYNGLMLECMVSNTALTNTQLDNVKSYYNARYALSL